MVTQRTPGQAAFEIGPGAGAATRWSAAGVGEIVVDDGGPDDVTTGDAGGATDSGDDADGVGSAAADTVATGAGSDDPVVGADDEGPDESSAPVLQAPTVSNPPTNSDSR